MNYTPIFDKDGNWFIIPEKEYVANSEEEAKKVGIACHHTICQWIGFDYTGEILEFNKTYPHVPAMWGETKILYIAGPIFDETPDI